METATIPPFEELKFFSQKPLDFNQTLNPKENLQEEAKPESFESRISNFLIWLKSAKNSLNSSNFEKSKAETVNYEIHIQELRDMIEKFHIEYFDENSKELTEYELEGEILNLKLNNDNLKNCNENLKAKSSNLKKKLKEQDIFFENKIATMKIENDDLKSKDQLNFKTQLESANYKIQELEEEIKEIKKQDIFLEEVQKISFLIEENESLKKDLCDYKKANRQMMIKINNIEEFKNNEIKNNNQIHQMEDVLKKMEMKNSSLQAELNEFKAELQKWKLICENQEKNNQYLKNQAQEEEKQNQMCIHNLKGFLSEKEKELRSKMGDTQIIRNLTKDINELREENKILSIKNQLFEIKDKEYIAFSEYTQKKNKKLEISLFEAQNNSHQLEIIKNDLLSQNTELNFKNNELISEKNELISKNEVELAKLNENFIVTNEKYQSYKRKFKDLKKLRELEMEKSISLKSERKKK